MGIGGLPAPRAHLGPRGWRLRRHASLARLGLRLEHLRGNGTGRNQQQAASKIPNREGGKLKTEREGPGSIHSCRWYLLMRRWAAEVRRLHGAAGAGEHRWEEAGELHGVTVLRNARTHPHTDTHSVSQGRKVKK